MVDARCEELTPRVMKLIAETKRKSRIYVHVSLMQLRKYRVSLHVSLLIAHITHKGLTLLFASSSPINNPQIL